MTVVYDRIPALARRYVELSAPLHEVAATGSTDDAPLDLVGVEALRRLDPEEPERRAVIGRQAPDDPDRGAATANRSIDEEVVLPPDVARTDAPRAWPRFRG